MFLKNYNIAPDTILAGKSNCKRFQSCSLLWELFLSLDPKFKKEESRSGFWRRSGPSTVCNVRYQAPYPQQLWNITDKKGDYNAMGRLWEQQ